MPPRLLGFLFLALLPLPAAATVDVYLFWSIGCPHCERAIEHLDRIAATRSEVRLHKLVAVFMLDDLVVLVAALKTLEVTGLTTRYARWSNAVGGVTLLAIGALLILRPEWLASG